jgi:hypothetical protein
VGPLLPTALHSYLIAHFLVYRRSGVPVERNESVLQRPGESFKMRDQYVALLILVFTKAGLLDVHTSGVLSAESCRSSIPTGNHVIIGGNTSWDESVTQSTSAHGRGHAFSESSSALPYGGKHPGLNPLQPCSRTCIDQLTSQPDVSLSWRPIRVRRCTAS